MQPNDQTINANQAYTHAQLLNNIQLLKEEREKGDDLLDNAGMLSGNIDVAQKYADAERMKQSIWVLICILIIIFGVKSLVFPSSATDVFNTAIFGIIIFLIVYVTENMGNYNIFAIWLLLMASLGTYIFKHIVDRN